MSDPLYLNTPKTLVNTILDSVKLHRGISLQPNCGDGTFLDGLRERGIEPFGIEANPDLVAVCKAKGHNVQHGDFLDCQLHGSFESVVLQLPLSSELCILYLEKGIAHLIKGGFLVAVASESLREYLPFGGRWYSLPDQELAAAREPTISLGYWVYQRK